MSGTLPARPSLEYLRKQAKQLLSASRRGDSAARARFARHLPGFHGTPALHDAQSVVARELGHVSWQRLRDEVRLRIHLPAGEPERVVLVAPAGDKVRPVDRHINCLAFAPGRETLLSAGMDGRIREWDPATGEEVRSVAAHPKSTNTLSFHVDETLVTTGCSDGTAAVHRWQSLETIASLPPKVGATSVFSPLGDRILSVGLDGRAYLWTWPGLERVAVIRELGRKVTARAFTPDGGSAVLAGLDGSLAQVLLEDGTVTPLRPGGAAPTVSLGFVPGADLLIAARYGGSLAQLAWPGLEIVAETAIGAPGVYAQRFHPSEEVFALCVERGVQLRRNDDLSLLTTLPIPAKGVYALAFSPDDRWLAAAGADQRIRIWAVAG